MSAPDFPHHSCFRSRLRCSFKPIPDQPFFTRFVKGLAGHCCHRFRCVAFFNRSFGKWRMLTPRWLANSRQLWPFSPVPLFFAGKKMIRALALLFAALIMLAGTGHAQAQGFGFDSRDIMGGGPNFFSGGG